MLKRLLGSFEAKKHPPHLAREARLRPDEYGRFWRHHDGGLEWYTWMYNGRLDQHEIFMQWFRSIASLPKIQSVLEFGCGMAVGYADFFKDIHYVGTDLAEDLITWCQTNRPNPLHKYIACDFITEAFPEKFDLVFSQGTIDNVYDMDAFLSAAVAASRNWIYITAYRGFFPELTEHRYIFAAEQGCYYNDISPTRVRQFLSQCGCHNIAVLPSHTGRADIPFETLIVAQVNNE